MAHIIRRTSSGMGTDSLFRAEGIWGCNEHIGRQLWHVSDAHDDPTVYIYSCKQCSVSASDDYCHSISHIYNYLFYKQTYIVDENREIYCQIIWKL